MKKSFMILLSSALLLSSCGTYTGSGAYVGGSFGSILGSAIGGIAGGPRGSDIGTIIGMAGGAAVGATIGSQADQQQEKRREQRRERIYNQTQNRQSSYQDDAYQQSPYLNDSNVGSGFDSSNSGEDRHEEILQLARDIQDDSPTATALPDMERWQRPGRPPLGGHRGRKRGLHQLEFAQ